MLPLPLYVPTFASHIGTMSKGLANQPMETEASESRAPKAQTFTDKINRRFTNFLKDIRSPDRKRGVGAQSSGQDGAASPRGSMGPAECHWVARTVGKALTVVAEETSMRFDELEQRTGEVEPRVDALSELVKGNC